MQENRVQKNTKYGHFSRYFNEYNLKMVNNLAAFAVMIFKVCLTSLGHYELKS